MNRLNFSQMVNKTLLAQPEQFFNVTEIYTDSYFESESYATKIKQATERLNLDGTIRNVVFNVHEQLRERQTTPSSARVKPKSTKENPKKKFKTKNQYQTIKEATVKDKYGEVAHKSTETTSNFVSFENYKRMLLAQQREHELENMIKEHKLLIEGRRSLEQDIFVMRHSLDDLQHRVNSSLQQLKHKKTFCECHGLGNKKDKENS